MDRVHTLVAQLQDELTKGAVASKMLLTARMLQHELQHLMPAIPAERELVTVHLPASLPLLHAEPSVQQEVSLPEVPDEEKTFEILQVDEAAIEAELEEMRRNAAVMQQISVKSKPQLLFDMEDDDIPTLPQKAVKNPILEINDQAAQGTPSVNDALKSETDELSQKLAEVPLKDLKKAIGINDRFVFINELFRGDDAMYERSIKTINGFSIYAEAEFWIRRELKTKLGWKDKDPVVAQFDQLIRRRFS